MEKTLKLYIWKNVLGDYTEGVVFALATDADSARKIVLKGAKDWEKRNLKAAMSTKPEVHAKSYGFAVWGGS